MRFAGAVNSPETNACIGVFSPSEPVTPERRERIETRLAELNAAGREFIFAGNWLEREAFQAGSATGRVSDIHSLLEREDVGLLLASWGGKSCAHLLQALDYDLARIKEKPILAFSDGCTLLNAITALSGIVTFYGPNVLGKLNESDYGDLSQFFTGNGFLEFDLKKEGSSQLNSRSNRVRGTLVGGNLSSFVASVLGSKYQPEFDDVILFLESGSKKPQEFDFLLSALRNSRYMSRVRGIIFGDIPEKEDPRWGNSVSNQDIVERVFGDTGIPVHVSEYFGHNVLPNPAFPIGALATLDAKDGKLFIESQCLK